MILVAGVRPSVPPEPCERVGDARPSNAAPSLWNWAPGLTLVVAGLLFCALVSLRPHDPERLVAIFPPWWSAGESLAAAASVGSVSGFGALPFLVAVKATRSGLAAQLRGAGALLVVDGTRFAFCGTSKPGI